MGSHPVLLLFCWLLVVQGRQANPQTPLGNPSQHRLNFSSPSPYIFSSIHGLLRQGYNTFHPNGFSIAPCQIPAFTPMYHGWLNDEPPQSPEWLAFTPEMAYGIMGSTRSSFMSTYQTTRSVKCLYFDGASGQLGEDGTMDVQMLFLYGNTTGPPGKNHSAQFLWDEYSRAQQLCAWLHENGLDTPGQGIEGIVRMSAGFELIWCDFTSPSIRLVSRFNASVPLLGYSRTKSGAALPDGKADASGRFRDNKAGDDLPAPDWNIDWEHEPFVASQQWDWFTATSRTYSSDSLASVRELSIKLMATGLVNLYSPQYQHHLAKLVENERKLFNLTSEGYWQTAGAQRSRRQAMQQLMRRQARHRVGNVSPLGVATMQDNMKQMVTRFVSRDLQIEMDWHDLPLIHTSDRIVDSYANRLMQIQRLLKQGFEKSQGPLVDDEKRLALLRERVHALLMPFFDYSLPLGDAAPSGPPHNGKEVQGSLDRCKSQHLPWLVRDAAYRADWADSLEDEFEARAMEDVMHQICTVLIATGTSIEETWFQGFNDESAKIPGSHQSQLLRDRIRGWYEGIEELTA
ncbi:MAG: hypothetical protein Q9169_006825, partial [Polycauliona sp. 2 TL-2023]